MRGVAEFQSAANMQDIEFLYFFLRGKTKEHFSAVKLK